MSGDSISDLEKALADARARADRASKALSPRHKGGEMEDFRLAREELLDAERALAAAKGEPHAVPIEFPVNWDVGAPMPHLICNDNQTHLVFFVREADTHWDGTYAVVRNPRDSRPQRLAHAVFDNCVSAKLGGPNDEALYDHPLYRRGLEFYSALCVVNSPWLIELETIHSAHPQYRSESWRAYQHFFLGFHDCVFECVAKAFSVEVRVTTLRGLLAEVCDHLAK